MSNAESPARIHHTEDRTYRQALKERERFPAKLVEKSMTPVPATAEGLSDAVP